MLRARSPCSPLSFSLSALSLWILNAARGHRRSFLSASCPAPKGFPGATFPFARASFGFGKRTLEAKLSRSCRVRG